MLPPVVAPSPARTRFARALLLTALLGVGCGGMVPLGYECQDVALHCEMSPPASELEAGAPPPAEAGASEGTPDAGVPPMPGSDAGPEDAGAPDAAAPDAGAAAFPG